MSYLVITSGLCCCFSFIGGESIERGDSTGGKPISLYQLHVRGKCCLKQERNILAIIHMGRCISHHYHCFTSQPWKDSKLWTVTCITTRLQTVTVAVNWICPSRSSTDHWDANPAGGWRDEGLCVLWSTREEEGHQVSMLSQAKPGQPVSEWSCCHFNLSYSSSSYLWYQHMLIHHTFI